MNLKVLSRFLSDVFRDDLKLDFELTEEEVKVELDAGR